MFNYATIQNIQQVSDHHLNDLLAVLITLKMVFMTG